MGKSRRDVLALTSRCTCIPGPDAHPDHVAWQRQGPGPRGVDHFGHCGHSELFRTTRRNPTANAEYRSRVAPRVAHTAFSEQPAALPEGFTLDSLLGALDRQWSVRWDERIAI